MERLNAYVEGVSRPGMKSLPRESLSSRGHRGEGTGSENQP